MLKQPLFIEQFILLAIVAVLHYLALEFFLYWSVPWFDILVHFLGGLWVGLAMLWLFFFSGFMNLDMNTTKKIRIFSITIATVILVGIFWEALEMYAGFVSVDEYGYALDTSTDLLMDTLGAVAASLYTSRKFQISR